VSLRRRDFLRASALSAGALALPAQAHAQADRAASPPPLRKPPRLAAGQHVRVVAPAGVCSTADIERATRELGALGLTVSAGAHALDRWGYFAGRDADRAADLNDAFRDPAVDAVFTLRGGWGCARLLPFLDTSAVAAQPKVLCGFSDITALHLALYAQTGLVSLHGPNAVSAYTPFTVDVLRRVAFDAEAATLANPADDLDPGPARTLVPGRGVGRLAGGNLTVLTALAGTPYLPDLAGHILYIEDIDEAVYRVDRMLTLLALSGALDGVRGVVFGSCNQCEADPDGFTLDEVLLHHLAPRGIPTYSNAAFGHLREKWTVPIGVQAEIDAGARTVRLLEPAVR
jgi:muramoyltetrapeptide carboxypeptidase